MIEQLKLRFTLNTKTAALFSILSPNTDNSMPSSEAESNFSKLWNARAATLPLRSNSVQPRGTNDLTALY